MTNTINIHQLKYDKETNTFSGSLRLITPGFNSIRIIGTKKSVNFYCYLTLGDGSYIKEKRFSASHEGILYTLILTI